MDEYESVLFVSRDVYVYRIPPRTTSAGYRASEWGDMNAPLWRGRLRVIEKGSDIPSQCVVRLEDGNTGDVFAVTPYSPSKKNPYGGVEPVLDSSRYFVLTIVNDETGSKAYIGMGFPERPEAFDFNVALQDWSKRQKPTPVLTEDVDVGPSPHLPPGGALDFSLKPGQTFNVQLNTSANPSASSSSSSNLLGSDASANDLSGGNFLLPPPPK